MVEQWTENPRVGSSILPPATILRFATRDESEMEECPPEPCVKDGQSFAWQAIFLGVSQGISAVSRTAGLANQSDS